MRQQLECFDRILENKRETARLYQEFFDSIGIKFITEPDNAKSNYWLNAILFDDRRQRDEFLEYSNDNDIQTRLAWALLHTLPPYQNCRHTEMPNAQYSLPHRSYFTTFSIDIIHREKELSAIVTSSRFLVIGGVGSIGSAVVCELFKRNPKLLHVVDISENNMVELVRDIRSFLGYIDGEFATFAIDYGSDIFAVFMQNGHGYDYVFNLSALKHVCNEKDPFTLMRMIDVNIFNTDKSIVQVKEKGAKKYFCVSTDKAANPVNMMGPQSASWRCI